MAPSPFKAKSPWIQASVPTTVLSALVEAKIFPDPYIGMNSTKIPDIGETGPSMYTYWFCCEFDVPLSIFASSEEDHWWLMMDGVNYSLSVYLNGAEIPIEHDRGMYLRRALDVTTDLQAGINHLAILVRPPDNPGKIPEGGGQVRNPCRSRRRKPYSAAINQKQPDKSEFA